MKNFLLPFLLVFLIACEKEEDKPTADSISPNVNSGQKCRIIEEINFNTNDTTINSSTKYYYDSDRIIKLVDSSYSSSSSDSTVFRYDGNNLTLVLRTLFGRLDTAAKYIYNSENRLIEVQSFINGTNTMNQKILYKNGKISEYQIIDSINNAKDILKVSNLSDNIYKLILIERNGVAVPSNTDSTIIISDNKINPYLNKAIEEFDKLLFFNRNNQTNYKNYMNGILSFEINYRMEYNDFNLPASRILDFEGITQKKEYIYECE